MTYRLFLALTTLLAVGVWRSSWASDDPDDGPKVGQSQDDKWEDLEKVRRLAVTASPEQLQKLVADGDDGIAIRAAWEKVRRQLAEDIAADNQKNPDGTLLKGADRFVGFLEGRLRVPVPRWWASELSVARARELEHPSFFCSIDTTGDVWSQIGPRGIATSFGIAPTLERDKSGDVKVVWDNRKLQLTAMQISNDRAPGDDLTGLVYRDRCLITRYDRSDMPRLDSEISCADLKTSKIVWSTKRTFDARREGPSARTGSSIHHISLVGRDDVVVLFGMEFSMVYIEAFRLTDGHSLWRFNSTY